MCVRFTPSWTGAMETRVLPPNLPANYSNLFRCKIIHPLKIDGADFIFR